MLIITFHITIKWIEIIGYQLYLHIFFNSYFCVYFVWWHKRESQILGANEINHCRWYMQTQTRWKDNWTTFCLGVIASGKKEMAK